MTFFHDRSGKPILPLGLQVHNSSTGVPEMLEREIKAVKHYGGNLLEAPVYWFRIEKEQGQFDFADVDDLIRDYGFKPETTIEEGLGKFAEWYKEYYNIK